MKNKKWHVMDDSKEINVGRLYSCDNRRLCSLFHILNNCMYNMKEMTGRHNAGQYRAIVTIKKYKHSKQDDRLSNLTIRLNKFEELKYVLWDEYMHLRLNI